MNEFILVFPLPVSPTECIHWLPKNASLHCPLEKATHARFAGLSFAFQWNLQPAHAGLSQIFDEHQALSPEESQRIDNHQSLLFLQGQCNSKEDFNAISEAIHIMIRSGAPGIYMEHCGCAHLAKNWESESLSHESTLEGWINFVQKDESLYTLGMETFQLPDLCVHMRHGDSQELQALLIDVADSMFLEGLEPDSGLKIQGLEGQNFEFRRETISLHSKGDAYHNLKGTWRLINN